MPTHENLAVAYHQQDTDYYCGAACAQMVVPTKNSVRAEPIALGAIHQ